MKKHAISFLLLCVTVMLLSACSSDGTSEAKDLLSEQNDLTENYVTGLEQVQNADDMVEVIENYTQGMKEIIPKMQALEEKYPEMKKGEFPEEMKEEAKRMEEIATRIQPAMMKNMQYMMNPKVQDAIKTMGEEMNAMMN